MLHRKAATEIATKHLAEMLPIEGAAVVEEHYQNDGVWQITLSYVPAGLHSGNGSFGARKYKTFTIDARSGEVQAMKIRSPKS